MEGERAFVQELKPSSLRKDNHKIAFKYSIGGGYKTSAGWEPLGPAGYYSNFGPEVSFGPRLARKVKGGVAIAKFTHSGTQILDWTPAGSEAKSRNIYADFIAFVEQSISELEAKGHSVELAGIFYHVGENDMSMHGYRKAAAERLKALISQSRVDLKMPELKWFVSQQPPTDDERVNSIDVTKDLTEMMNADEHTVHIKAFQLSGQEQKLVITTKGIVELGELLADSYLKSL